MRKITTTTLALLFIAGLALGFTAGCESEQGPAEKAGEAIDDAVDELKDSGEDLGDQLEDAGEELKEGLEEAKEEIDGGGDG